QTIKIWKCYFIKNIFDNFRIIFANCSDMEKVLRKTIYCLLFICIGTLVILSPVPNAFSQQMLPKTDMGVNFLVILNAPDVDFSLKITCKRKFKSVLDNKLAVQNMVKIYDISGHIIKEDGFIPEEGVETNFDISNINSKLLVMEVGHSNYYKTNSI